MARKTLLIFTCGMIMLFASGCFSCKEENNEAGKYIHTFDWHIGDKNGSIDNVVYLFDDQEVGKGETGFQCIIDSISELPQGGVVIIIKNYILEGHRGSNYMKSYPFDFEMLSKCARDNDIRLCYFLE